MMTGDGRRGSSPRNNGRGEYCRGQDMLYQGHVQDRQVNGESGNLKRHRGNRRCCCRGQDMLYQGHVQDRQVNGESGNLKRHRGNRRCCHGESRDAISSKSCPQPPSGHVPHSRSLSPPITPDSPPFGHSRMIGLQHGFVVLIHSLLPTAFIRYS